MGRELRAKLEEVGPGKVAWMSIFPPSGRRITKRSMERRGALGDSINWDRESSQNVSS